MPAAAVLVVLVLLGAPIALVVVLVSMHRRLSRLEREVRGDAGGQRLTRLENQVAALRDLIRIRSDTAPLVEAPQPREERPAVPTPPAPVPVPPTSAPPKSTRPAPAASAAGPTVPVADWFGSARAWLLGGNTVVRVGMIVVLFGVGFFLKYSFDQGWISIQTRLMSAALGGLALAGLGWRLRNARPDFAWVVQGGGIGIVYLTVFASANFYDLISESFATLLMVVLVALASAMAIAGNALSLAAMAAVGGFMAPVLVSSGGSHTALFAYYLVLDAGILFVARFRAWRTLNLIGFVFTFVVGAAWGARYYRPDFFSSTEPFLIAFFLLYVVVPILFAARTAESRSGFGRPGRGIVDGTLVFGTPLVVFGLQSLLVRDFGYGAAWSAVGAAAIYAALAIGLRRRETRLYGLLSETFVALAVAFGTLAIPLAFDARWTGMAWALEGAGLVWVGVRQSQLLSRLGGLAMQLAAAGAYFVALQLVAQPERPILNGIFVGAVLMSASGLASAWILRKESLAIYSVATLGWGLVWWFGAGLNEIVTFLDGGDSRIHAFLLFAAGSLGLLVWLRRFLDWGLLRWPGLSLGAIMVVGTPGLFAIEDHPFSPTGFLVWAGVFCIQYWQLVRVDRREDWPVDVARFSHAVTLWLATFLLSWEAAWGMDRIAGDRVAWEALAWILVPLAAIVVVGRLARHPRPGWPFRPHAATYVSALALPALACVLWTIWESFRVADPAPLPYVSILNPVELGQIAAFLIVVGWARSAVSTSGVVSDLLTVSDLRPPMAGVGFLALNGIIARAIHFYVGVPFRPDALWDSEAYQTAVSIAWTLAALVVMVGATRWKRRGLWVTGASLLGLVVVKLFLVDLAGIGTIARIVSFLVVGSLTLLIGYLSPLPPRVVERAS